jgi:hypothetical protein
MITSRSFKILLLLVIFFSLSGSVAQNLNGQTSSECLLPDPLIMNNGEKVKNFSQWQNRRKELIEFFTNEMYGRSPGRPSDMRFEITDTDTKALGGKAIRKQVVIYFTGKTNGPKMEVLIYLPANAKKPVPVFLGLNFWGNQAINPDPGIKISESWIEESGGTYVDLSCVKNNKATENCRGINSSQWPVETLLERGYGLVTAYRGDIDSDFYNGFTNSLYSQYPELQGRGDNFCAMSAWAWSLRRIMDYLETDKNINASKVALFGWSRLGKAALWAAAQDERFAMLISIQSGAGGVKLFHRGVGENIRRLCTVFPHWYCANFKKYMDKDTCLSFDQHMVIALVAPRPVYISSAADDKNADPEGEFEGAKAAEPVYKLLKKEGLPAERQPPINQPVFGQIGYHVRSGNHNVTSYDWEQYLHFADIHLK